MVSSSKLCQSESELWSTDTMWNDLSTEPDECIEL